MDSVKEREKFANPYVVQIDRFAKSLKHLSETFLCLESYKKTFTKDEVAEMFDRVSEKVCVHCENRNWCLNENRESTCLLIYEILCAVEEYGAELNIELKRKLKKKCLNAPRFLREILSVFENAKQKLLWNNKIVQNREGCAEQLVSFANMIQHTVRELDAGIFTDVRMEKRIRLQFRKEGIKVANCILILTKQGFYEVHLTLKSQKKQCVPVKEAAQILARCVGRNMRPEKGERRNITDEYCTIVCTEVPKFQTLQGVAKIGKGCEIISGDTFLLTELPGGKVGVVLSDGMGTGETAFQESAMVVEMLEELLWAGFPMETAIQMMNTALVIGREEVRFSTIDMCVFDLYQGSCEFLKAGAATTFVKYADRVEKVGSASLPIGVVQNLELEHTCKNLEDGTFVVMMTDGVMDALPIGEQEALMSTFIRGTNINNAKELAHHILGQVLEWTGDLPQDDMTVIVVGLWKL